MAISNSRVGHLSTEYIFPGTLRQSQYACQLLASAKDAQAHLIGRNVVDGVLEATQQIILDQIVQLDQALINVDSGVDDVQAYSPFYCAHLLWRCLHHHAQSFHLSSVQYTSHSSLA